LPPSAGDGTASSTSTRCRRADAAGGDGLLRLQRARAGAVPGLHGR
jgi:hypothetical protein